METTTLLWNKVGKVIDENLDILMKKYPEDFISQWLRRA